MVAGGTEVPAQHRSWAVQMERKRQRWDRWSRREKVLGIHLREAMCPKYTKLAEGCLGLASCLGRAERRENHSFIQPTSSEHRPHRELTYGEGKTQSPVVSVLSPCLTNLLLISPNDPHNNSNQSLGVHQAPAAA